MKVYDFIYDETFVYVTYYLCIKYLFDNSYIMIYRSNNCDGS